MELQEANYLTMEQVLSQDLEEADPTVHKIIEQVRLTPPPSCCLRWKLTVLVL